MSLPTVVAEQILRGRFGEPAKPATQYVIGFRTPSGRVLAMDRVASETRIWFQPPAPPRFDGVALMPATAKNSNLNGPLSPLDAPDALRVEPDSENALHSFLDWYENPSGTIGRVDSRSFYQAFARFQQLIATEGKGRAFTNFHEGVIAAWESYKPHLRDLALGLLGANNWVESSIGSGDILNHTIRSIEIQDSRTTLINNLVFWQNRFGHANRDHRALLEAASNQKLCRELEHLLFSLYRNDANEGATFDRLSELTGAKYPLLAYLYFLKDMDRFMPIQPTGFDRAFRALNIDFSTLRHCSWYNYSTYNAILTQLRPMLEAAAGLKNVRLIDAHSFCWILAHLLKLEERRLLANGSRRGDAGRILGAREKSIIAMRLSVENTVKNSNGQIVERTVKNKELHMTSAELEKVIASLLDLQDNRCALTGIPLQFLSPDADKNLQPSLDRIDSNGHYEAGNLQVVCQFVNFWKGSANNEEFRRLLMLVRDVGETE
jgi:hypothetical protein